MRLFIFTLLILFSNFAFAIRGSDIANAAAAVLLFFVAVLSIMHILLTVSLFIVLLIKWNQMNKIFKEISQNINNISIKEN